MKRQVFFFTRQFRIAMFRLWFLVKIQRHFPVEKLFDTHIHSRKFTTLAYVTVSQGTKYYGLQVYIVYMGGGSKGDVYATAEHTSILEATIGRYFSYYFQIVNAYLSVSEFNYLSQYI